MDTPRTVDVLLVVMALQLGVIVGQVAGVLAAVSGASIAATFATGGGAFAVTMTLALLVENTLTCSYVKPRC